MNKSIEFIKNRIGDNSFTSNMPTDGWDDSVVLNPMEQYLQYNPEFKSCFISDNEFQTTLECDLGKTNVNVQYNPDSDFSYFTMETSTHDGTLCFTFSSVEKLLFKLLRMGIYDKNVVTSDFIENPFNYNIKYIIGDVIIHTDYGSKTINGRVMDGVTDIVVLPIKFEFLAKN